jgi:Protein of unknown function (DUF3251)
MKALNCPRRPLAQYAIAEDREPRVTTPIADGSFVNELSSDRLGASFANRSMSPQKFAKGGEAGQSSSLEPGCFVGLFALILACGCRGLDADRLATLEQKSTDLQTSIEHLEQRLTLLEQESQLHVSRLKALENVTRSIDLGSVAVVSCQSQGFSYMKTELGTLTMSCINASKYMDGVKVRLRLGNPTSATITHMTVTVEPFLAEGSPGAVVQDVVTPMRAGAWSIIDIAVPRVSEENLGLLSVKAAIDQISLSTK